MIFKSSLASAIESYLEYRKGMHYGGEGEKRYLSSFDDYCAENFPDEKTLTKDAVRGWFFDEISKGHLALENKAITIRMFARFLGPLAYMLPMKYVPKTPQYVPYIMTDKELADLFRAADKFSHPLNPFLDEIMPVLLRFIYACGLRPGEALRLKTDDVDLRTGEIFIKDTKRHKDRIIIALDDALTLLKRFAIIRNIKVGKTAYFFCNEDGAQVRLYQLDRAVKKCWQKAHPDINPKQLPRVRAYDLSYPNHFKIQTIFI